MKQLVTSMFILGIFLGFTVQGHATLQNRGTDINGNRLIYDSDLNITWYDYTKSANTWQNQLNWASGLTVNLGGTIFDDWRLPSTGIGIYAFGYDGTTMAGYNITSSEMGHLFYTDLNNIGSCNTSGQCNQTGYGLVNTGSFQNMYPYDYWSVASTFDPNQAWSFNLARGVQSERQKSWNFYAIAVRSGDVAIVPEPISSILFLTGGATLIGIKYIRRKKIEV